MRLSKSRCIRRDRYSSARPRAETLRPSKTVTFMPRALSASAADNPPIPAPTMAIFSLSVIGPIRHRTSRFTTLDHQLPMTSSSSTHLVPSKRAILAFLQPIRFDGVTLIDRPGRNSGS